MADQDKSIASRMAYWLRDRLNADLFRVMRPAGAMSWTSGVAAFTCVCGGAATRGRGTLSLNQLVIFCQSPIPKWNS